MPFNIIHIMRTPIEVIHSLIHKQSYPQDTKRTKKLSTAPANLLILLFFFGRLHSNDFLF